MVLINVNKLSHLTNCGWNRSLVVLYICHCETSLIVGKINLIFNRNIFLHEISFLKIMYWHTKASTIRKCVTSHFFIFIQIGCYGWLSTIIFLEFPFLYSIFTRRYARRNYLYRKLYTCHMQNIVWLTILQMNKGMIIWIFNDKVGGVWWK